MTFEPEPGMQIRLGKDEVIEFLPLEESGLASVFVYAESGKEGTVYKVLKNQEKYALKVFYPEYRDIRLHENTEKLTRFKDLEGFRVAERNLFEPDEYPQLLKQYPDLTYAVLMPWIEGTIWGNLMLDPDPTLKPDNYIQIAKTLTRVISKLEGQGLAHCDLSNNNFIIVHDLSEIELIDVESMYAPDMPRPIPDISYGTIGYRTPWIAEHGLWRPESDRFATAILCSEILVWHNEEIQEKRSGNTSFFDEDEIGQENERFELMIRYLDEMDKTLPMLFEKAWFSKDFSQCPPVAEWFETVQNIGAESVSEQESLPTENLSEEIILDSKETASGEEEAQVGHEAEQLSSLDVKEASAEEAQAPETPMGEEMDEAEIETLAQKRDGTIPKGVPPKMDISIEMLDFGIVGKPENTRQFSITNSGGAPLIVSIQPEDWVNISHPRVTLAPDETQIITATLNAKYPRPHKGREFRTAMALSVDSNVGTEVISAQFIIPKPPFYASGWKRALLGVAIGIIFSFIISVLINLLGLIRVEEIYIVVPATLVLFGLAGLAAYPRKASILFSIAGFVVTEIIIGLLIAASYIYDGDAILLLGLGAGLGILGGAIASRIFFGKIRPPKDNLKG